jgi:IclR family transcriptional regulator, acetate operon repressor
MMADVPPNETTGPYSIRAVDRVLDVLDVLRARPSGASLAQIARGARLPRSSAFRYLATLEARGYVERDGGDSLYRLGTAFLDNGPWLRALSDAARPLLEALRDRFHETINLGFLEGNRVAYLEVLESPMAMRFAARPGDRDHVHSTSLGKALMAQLPDDGVRRILSADEMVPVTARTITDPDEYLRQLATVREIGFAVDHGENEEHGGCVAVAIMQTGVSAAISLSAPIARLSPARVDEVAAALRETAARVVEELGSAHA